jgi:outer membrane protein assembly factor BamD (BamD/ComL family)
MKLLPILLALAALTLHADTVPTADPARQLYDEGMRQTEAGKLADARIAFEKVVEAYPRHPLALDAKCAIDATLLFEEGQARVKAGKHETARVTFETLIAVYPENPLAARAKAAIEAIGEKEKDAAPVLQSLEFRDLATPVEEIRAAMDAREVRLSVGQPCRQKDVQQAKAALAEILAEKGVAHARVEARTRAISPDAVAVIFSVEKTRASVLSSPWRLAKAGWHRVHAASDTQDSGI